MGFDAAQVEEKILERSSSGTKHWSDIKSTLMSSNGVTVKQQFFCLLYLSIINLKGTFFHFFPPQKAFSTWDSLTQNPPGKLKMLKKIRFFSLWFLTPNSRQDNNCQNISQTSKNIYIYLKKSILTSTSSTRTFFFLYYCIKEQLTPLKLCIQLLLPPCLKEIPFNVTQLQQDLHSSYRQ